MSCHVTTMILFSKGLGSVAFTACQKHVIETFLQTCDDPRNKLYYLNTLYNNCWHTGNVQYLTMDTPSFLGHIAHVVKDPVKKLLVEGTIHAGDVHTSCLFPGRLVQDQYIRCRLDDGTVCHIIMDEPIVV